MAYSVILMQENYLFRLGATESIVQPQSQAVNVAPYTYIVPFIHVRTSPENSIGASPNLVFSWFTAAALPTQFDVKPPGTFGNRFVELSGGTVAIVDEFTGTTEGKTYTTAQITTDGGFKAITNAGGLLLWKCTNGKTGVSVAFRADIYLVCRGA